MPGGARRGTGRPGGGVAHRLEPRRRAGVARRRRAIVSTASPCARATGSRGRASSSCSASRRSSADARRSPIPGRDRRALRRRRRHRRGEARRARRASRSGQRARHARRTGCSRGSRVGVGDRSGPASSTDSIARRAACSSWRDRRARTTRSSRRLDAAHGRPPLRRARVGRLTSPRGVIDAPIGRSSTRRTRMAVRDAGKPARTAYEVVARRSTTPVCSLARVPARDRSHAPDPRAPRGDRPPDRRRRDLRRHPRFVPLRRPFLHARGSSGSTTRRPGSGSFEEPLPADLRAVLDQLGPARVARVFSRRLTAPGGYRVGVADAGAGDEVGEREALEHVAALLVDADPHLLQDAVALAVVGVLRQRESADLRPRRRCRRA